MAKIYSFEEIKNGQKYFFVTDTNAIIGIVKDFVTIDDNTWLILNNAIIGKTEDFHSMKVEISTNEMLVSMAKVSTIIPVGIAE